MGAALWAAALAVALGTMVCGVKGSPQAPLREEPDGGGAATSTAAPTSTPNPSSTPAPTPSSTDAPAHDGGVP